MMSSQSRAGIVLLVALVALGALTYGDRVRFSSRLTPVFALVQRVQRALGLPSRGADSGRAGAAQPPTAAPQAAPAATARAEVSIDPRRQQLIGVRTTPVTRATLAQTIRTVGLVRYDETRLADVNVKVEGWIRDLYVDYTGRFVSRDRPLFTLYSPELLMTENEYQLAFKTRERLQQSQVPDARERAEALVTAARQRLELWDLPPDQIRALDEQREPQVAVPFHSPVDGFVIEKQALKGMHVMPGQSLYKIADLSVVWVEADVYEKELPLVRVGGRAVVTLDVYPDERLVGHAAYIYPYVEEKTRTNKVRYEFENRAGRLKPGMYANVEIDVGGGVGLIVPTDAVLDSGKEQLVFVAHGDGYFEPRHVKIGRRLGENVQILEGVKEGEQVAAGATFFLDSESQLRGSLQGYEAAPVAQGAPAAREQLDIAFRSQPDPPKIGENQMEVTVKDSSGKPIDGAEVDVQFFMPAMPTMNMPAMRNNVKLSPSGGGVYRGTGQVLMAGQWEATVAVTRNGQRLGAKQLTVVAR